MRKELIAISLLLAGCPDGSKIPPGQPDPTNTCTAIVDWKIPETFVNGEQLLQSDLQRLTIYINEEPGLEQATITRVEELLDVYLIQWTVTELPIGEHWFYMTITATNGEVSAFSNELSKVCR